MNSLFEKNLKTARTAVLDFVTVIVVMIMLSLIILSEMPPPILGM